MKTYRFMCNNIDTFVKTFQYFNFDNYGLQKLALTKNNKNITKYGNISQ